MELDRLAKNPPQNSSSHSAKKLKNWGHSYSIVIMQLIYESPGSRFVQHYCSLYLRKYLRRTQKLGHCNVFIMQEYLAEFQFCKVILHLLSDAGASNDVFWIHYKLTTDMVKELYQTLSSRPQFWIFNYFCTKCIFRVVQSVFFNYCGKSAGFAKGILAENRTKNVCFSSWLLFS